MPVNPQAPSAMSVPPRGGGALSVLRRIATRPQPNPDQQTCDMCAEPISDDHRHVVDIQSRQLMCTCRGCGLLFTADAAHQRYRAVPDRYLSFPDFELTEAEWDSLDIPVGLAFFFSSSVLGRVVAFYPGPCRRSRVGARTRSLDRRSRGQPRARGTQRRCGSSPGTRR